MKNLELETPKRGLETSLGSMLFSVLELQTKTVIERHKNSL